MEYNKQGHAVYYTRYHIVLATRYRRKIFRGGVGDYLIRRLKEIGRHYPEIRILEAKTDEDHLHMLVSIPPKMAVSQVVNVIKSNTGKSLRDKFDFMRYVFYGRGGVWSVGYFVSTGGVSEEVIRKYLEHQGKEDRGQAELAL